MSIQAETVLNSLKVCSDVKIVFKSLLTANKMHTGHYTLVGKDIEPVSYTHLTLPTICSV